jgi:hypothetical protein
MHSTMARVEVMTPIERRRRGTVEEKQQLAAESAKPGRTVSQVAPARTGREHVHDAADDAPIVVALGAGQVRRQVWCNACPLLVTRPEQPLAHQNPPERNRFGTRESLFSN